MKETVFIKKYIKTEDDLPKEPGFYFVNWTPGHGHHTTMAAQYYDESIKALWFGKGWFDWYLQEEELPTDEEIEKKAEYYATEEGGEDITPMIQQPDLIAFYDGAKWAINKLLNK